jgi:hypothetical protein
MTARIVITDALPSKLERERHELIVRRAVLCSQLSSDPDPDLRERIERIDRKLRALEGKRERRRRSS